jgi:hypothetical protein
VCYFLLAFGLASKWVLGFYQEKYMSAQNIAQSDSAVIETVSTVPAAQIRRIHSVREERVAAFEKGVREGRDNFDAFKAGKVAARKLLLNSVAESVFGETLGDRAKMLAKLETL